MRLAVLEGINPLYSTLLSLPNLYSRRRTQCSLMNEVCVCVSWASMFFFHEHLWLVWLPSWLWSWRPTATLVATTGHCLWLSLVCPPSRFILLSWAVPCGCWEHRLRSEQSLGFTGHQDIRDNPILSCHSWSPLLSSPIVNVSPVPHRIFKMLEGFRTEVVRAQTPILAILPLSWQCVNKGPWDRLGTLLCLVLPCRQPETPLGGRS